MTRREMRIFGKDTLNEVFGTPGDDSPFAWDSLLSTSADDLARATDTLWSTVRVNVIQGKSDYNCFPLYKIRRMQIIFPYNISETRVRNLEIVKPEWVDYTFNQWDTNPQQGIPGQASVNGVRTISLYPIPNFTRNSSLVISGYGVPGNNWDNDDDECPLPEWAHKTVVYGAMIDRAMKIDMPPNRMAILEQRYKEGRGRLEVEGATNTRAKAVQSGDGLGFSSNAGFNPLNL